MPTVRRQHYRNGYRQDIRYPVSYNDMTEPERRNYKKEKVIQGMAAVIAGTVLVASWTSSGNGGDQSPDAAAAGMRQKAATVYLSHSTRQKFEDTYITPIELKGDYLVHDRGLRGEMKHWRTTAYESQFGQMCLRGSGYDTTPSNIRTWSGGGDISAIASLSQNGSEVSVYPAGSNAPSLQFKLISGELIPDNTTVMTLAANDCEPTSGLAVARQDRFHNQLESVPGFLETIHPGVEQ